MTDDTNTIPEVLNAPWLKRFFQQKLGIPVRIKNAGGSKWIHVWIPCDLLSHSSGELKFSHDFPPQLGQRCMAIVYKGHETLSKQSWGGNIQRHSIAMHGYELRKLLAGLIADPINRV